MQDPAARTEREAAQPGAPWWLLAIVCAAAFAAFAQSVNYDFVFDDDMQVLRNPWIRDWSLVGKFFTQDVWSFSVANASTNYYRPLHMVAHAVGYTLSGMKPYGYHLINILLHCVCAVLVTLFGLRLTRDRFTGVAGGLIFALHPVHAESVAWIAGVTDPLCAVFYFGALWIHAHDEAESRPRRSDVWIALLFLCALWSKEMAFTFPVAAAWLDWCLRRKLRPARYAMMGASFGVYAVLRAVALQHFFITMLDLPLGLSGRILSSLVLIAQYVTKAFVPFDISAFHVFRPTTSLFDPRFILGFIALSAVSVSAWVIRKNRRVLFLLGFVVLTLIPVMNVTGVGENIFADRYLYIASFGSCLLMALAIGKIPKWPALNRGWVRSEYYVLAALLIAFALVLGNTTFMWRDNTTLYTETMKRSPDAAPIAANLARDYFYKGQYDDAERWLVKTQELWKGSFVKNIKSIIDTYVRQSAISLRKGNAAEAMDYLQKAYSIDPRDPGVLQNLGSANIVRKDYAAARKWFEAAIAVNPRNEIGYNNLSFVSVAVGDYDRAIEYAEKALEIYPQYGDAYLNLARASAAKGSTAQAREAYRRARLADPKLEQVVDQELKSLEAPQELK